MSGPPAENSALVRATVLGAACGLTLVFGGYAVCAALYDRLRRG